MQQVSPASRALLEAQLNAAQLHALLCQACPAANDRLVPHSSDCLHPVGWPLPGLPPTRVPQKLPQRQQGAVHRFQAGHARQAPLRLLK